MRTGPLIFVLMALIWAPLASSRAADRPMAAAPRNAQTPPAGLRGPVSPTPPTSPGNAAGLALKPGLPIASLLASAGAGAGQCRLDCAHNYYFCLSGSDTSYCSQAWTSCLTDCGHPSANPVR
jgi:hypothetical protein